MRWLARAGVLATAALLWACGGGGSADPSAAQTPPAIAAPLLKAELAPVDAGTAFRGHGTWWNPAEPGTGFFFEAQAATGVVTFYVFDDAGKPVWYSASGPFVRTDSGFAFEGTLLRFAGGQSAASSTPRVPTSTAVGPVRIAFTGESAAVQLPGRAFTAVKFFAGDASRSGSARAPETGIYWNPAESGRGYTIEQQDGVATVGVFHYDADGAPTWNLSVVRLQTSAPGFNTGDLLAYAGGQTLAGAFSQSPTPRRDASLSIAFGTACTGQLRFQRVPVTVPLQRFSFAGLSERDTCRAWSTLPGAQPLAYDQASLPLMSTPRTSASATFTATFSLGAQNPQTVTAFADVALLPQISLPTGGVARYRWLSGTLPPGLAFDAATGAVRGQAAQLGSSTFEIAATIDGYGGQVALRQTLQVRAPILSYEGYAGRDEPLYTTSFERELLTDPRQLLVLRDPDTLQPLTLPAGVAVSYAVAPGSTLPAGLRFDAAAQAIVGIPTTLTARHDTVFEVRLSAGGATLSLQGTVPLRVDPLGALTTTGRIDYELLPVVTSAADVQEQLTAQGLRGFRFLANLGFQNGRSAAVYARDSRETWEALLTFAAADPITLRTQLLGQGGQGYQWGGLMGPRYEHSVFLKGSAGTAHEMIAVGWNTGSASGLVSQANLQGAQGYAYAGHRSFSGQIVSLHDRELASPARYEYQASTENPRTQPDFLARINAQGARGLRIRPVEVPQPNLAAGTLPVRTLLLERDTSQAATFSYSSAVQPRDEAEFREVALREGRTGGILAASYLNLGLPGTLLFVRPLRCTGAICRAAQFMPQ